MRTPKKRQLTLQATPQEQCRFERIKKYYKRTSDSDTIRMLIDNEAEKISLELAACRQD